MMTCFCIFQLQEVPFTLHKSSRNSDAQNILLPQKCIICNKINIYKNQKLLSLGSCERKQKDTGQCMVQEPICATVTAVNDNKILRLCENYNFLAVEARYHKECYVQYIKWAEQNEGSKTKEVVQKSQYEITEFCTSKREFCTSATLLENNQVRLIFLPKDFLPDDLAIKAMEQN